MGIRRYISDICSIQYIIHCPKTVVNIGARTEPVTVEADATVHGYTLYVYSTGLYASSTVCKHYTEAIHTYCTRTYIIAMSCYGYTKFKHQF